MNNLSNSLKKKVLVRIVVYFVLTLKLTPGTYIGGGSGFLETSLSLAFACDSFIEQIECIAK